LKVQTTLDLDLQQTANRALADGLATYERRKGWTGKLENVLDKGIDARRLQASRLGGEGPESRRLRARHGDQRSAHGD
jgi:membrane carboxypeptidase/penicillin-binding protein